MPNRIKDFSTLATLPAADDFELLDGATNGTRKISANVRANVRNALAPRGGIAFDGTGGTKCYATLTNQSIGTDPVSLVGFCLVPTTNPATAVGLLTLTSDLTNPGGPARNFSTYISTGGTLVVELYGATGADFNRATVANFVSNHAGKRVMIAIIRDASGNPGIYLNGAAQTPTFTTAGSPAGWQGSITSTYFSVGYVTSSNVFNGCFYSATAYNLALSAADILEIFELGGAVPERFKWGSQANLVSGGGFVNGIFGSTLYDTFSGGTATGFTATKTQTSAAAAARSATSPGTPTFSTAYTYTVKWSLALNSGTAPTLAIDKQGGATDASISLTAGNGSAVYTPGTPTANGFSLRVVNAAGELSDFTLSSLTFAKRGAFVHLPLQDGIGFQLQDVSTNRLHAMMTTSGITHALPFVGPARIRGLTSTSGNEQLCGQAALPSGYQILAVRARARTGAPNVSVGWASGASTVVTSTGLTQNWKTLPLTAAAAAPVTGSTDSLWVNSNTGDVIEWDVTWVPVTP